MKEKTHTLIAQEKEKQEVEEDEGREEGSTA